MPKINKPAVDSKVTVTLVNSDDPLLIYIDDQTFRISQDTEVPAEYLDTLLSTGKIKVAKKIKEES